MTDEQPPDSDSPTRRSRRRRLDARRRRTRRASSIAVVVVAGRRRGATRRRVRVDRRRPRRPRPPAARPAPTTAVGSRRRPHLGAAKAADRCARSTTTTRCGCGSAATRSPARSVPRSATRSARPASSRRDVDYKVSSGLVEQRHPQLARARRGADGERRPRGGRVHHRHQRHVDRQHGRRQRRRRRPTGKPTYRAKVDRDDGRRSSAANAPHGVLARPADARRPTTWTAARSSSARSCAQEAAKCAPDVVYVDTYQLFDGPDGGVLASHPRRERRRDHATRISDGVHFTDDGAEYLGRRRLHAARRALAHHRAGRPVAADRLDVRRRAAASTCRAIGRHRRGSRYGSSDSTRRRRTGDRHRRPRRRRRRPRRRRRRRPPTTDAADDHRRRRRDHADRPRRRPRRRRPHRRRPRATDAGTRR